MATEITWFEDRPLSNFWPAETTFRGHTYPTSEHAYQAAKATSAADHDRVAGAATPDEAKRLGQEIAARPDWLQVRVEVMSDVLRAKFAPGTAAAQHLLATGDAPLIEGNTWHDNVWGDCRCGGPRCAEPGTNQLGLLLMELRDEISARPGTGGGAPTR